VVWDCAEASALAAHDFKVTATATLNGILATAYQPTKCSRMELDGSTGLLIATDGSEFGFLYDDVSYWTGAMLYASIEDMITGWDGAQTLAFQVRFSALAGQAATYDGAGIMLVEKPTPDADLQIFQAKNGWSGSNQVQLSKGGTPASLGSATKLFMEIVYPVGGRAPFARFGDWPGTWEDPGAWAADYVGAWTPGNYQNPQAGGQFLTGAATNLVGMNVNQQTAGGGPVSATIAGWRVLTV
jgi:hypothetical protein